MSTDAKHTQGPWNIVEHTPSLIKTAGGDTFIQVTEIVPGLPTDRMRVEEMWANARLCAAAPDLLCALKNIIQSIEVNDDRAVNLALAAIAKAETA